MKILKTQLLTTKSRGENDGKHGRGGRKFFKKYAVDIKYQLS